MERTAILPGPLRMMQRPLLAAAVKTLPGWARERLAVGPAWALADWERKLARFAGATADRLVLPSSPPVQACRRLGLPDDWLAPR